MRTLHFLAALAALIAAPAALAVFENPADNATVSGVSIISGWHCTATHVEVEFDGTIRSLAATGTDRLDTLATCGRRDTGFGLLFNWGVLSPGAHTLKVYADGIEFGSHTVTVVGLGAQFLDGKSATVTVNEFPSPGRALVLDWQTGLQSFVARAVRVAPSMFGTWNGANLERRSNCTASQNNGSRGTYAQWDVNLDPVSNAFSMTETGITGLSCTYRATDQVVGNEHQLVDGTYTCTDGKQGAFHSTAITVTDTALSIRLAIKLSGSETCDVDAIIGGSRF